MKNIDLANKEVEAVLKKHGVAIEPQIDFPRYKKLPDEVLLAVSVLNKHGVKILFSIVNK